MLLAEVRVHEPSKGTVVAVGVAKRTLYPRYFRKGMGLNV